jgi:hypothetical protein
LKRKLISQKVETALTYDVVAVNAGLLSDRIILEVNGYKKESAEMFLQQISLTGDLQATSKPIIVERPRMSARYFVFSSDSSRIALALWVDSKKQGTRFIIKIFDRDLQELSSRELFFPGEYKNCYVNDLILDSDGDVYLSGRKYGKRSLSIRHFGLSGTMLTQWKKSSSALAR